MTPFSSAIIGKKKKSNFVNVNDNFILNFETILASFITRIGLSGNLMNLI